MKLDSQKLIAELTAETNAIIAFAESLKQLSPEQLNKRQSSESWSALECLQHLNLYGIFYLPEIKKQLNPRKGETSNQYYKTGLLGNYFANSMKPKANLNKMKTFQEMNPIHSQLNNTVIDAFLSQQKEMVSLLEHAKLVHLGKRRTSISISKLIKLKLGDTFRFVIYHNMRHVEQAKRVLGGV